ncbi:uncharacterized protein LOC116254267 isoform X2 [Nymphaea colorata]|nr:uncharacterized protein LOC116254267 isoform X2 [Nymphaea colorata]
MKEVRVFGARPFPEESITRPCNYFLALIFDKAAEGRKEEGEMKGGNGREEDGVRRAREWLESVKCLAEKEGTHEYLAIAGLRFVRTERARFVCSLCVPRSVTDSEGKWSRGAMATLMDDMCALAVMSYDLPTPISVEYSISYFSEVAAKEEVEIESRALTHKGKLWAVVVEIRKKATGERVALARQWMAVTSKI